MSNIELSNYQIQRIAHSLGVQLYHAILSDKKKDRTLPKEFYRNYYQISQDTYLEQLVGIRCATKRETMGVNVYHITEKGIDAFRKRFEELIQYTPESNRDLNYLKTKINLYCWYHSYTLSTDYIVSKYLEDYRDGGYVSHTTKDVIETFKKELKKYCK